MNITPGAAEVIVVQNDPVAAAMANKGSSLRDRLASAAGELGIRDLLTDLAENHEHYARGTAKGIDRP